MRAGNFDWMKGMENKKSQSVNKAIKKTQSTALKMAGV